MDQVKRCPGITLNELRPQSEMTRFGVMSHLRILERCGLVVTRRDGRLKRHYLNVVPLELAIRPFLDRLGRIESSRLIEFRDLIERGDLPVTDAQRLVFEIVINAPQQAVWNALVNGDETEHYFHRTRIDLGLASGSAVRYIQENGDTAVDGTVLEIDPPRLLTISWKVHYDPVLEQEEASRVSFELLPMDGLTKLTVIHDRFAPDSRVRSEVAGGWVFILSNLKTYLETGTPMTATE